MVPGSRFIRLLWLVVLAGAFMAFNGEHAEAEEALASWYGPGFEGRPTASGEPYDPNGLTAAHKTLPLGTEVLVSYGGRTVPVTINDRGPFVGDRELDLSQGAARALGLTKVGVDYVDWELANGSEPATPQGTTQQPGITPTGMLAGTPATSAPASTPTTTEPGLTSDGYAAGSPSYYPRSYPPPAQEAASSGPAYTVQPGDTLAQIAARLGTSADYLASRNGITDPNLIYDGQALYFPLLVEDPSGAGAHGTTGGASIQSPMNAGNNTGGGGLMSPVYESPAPTTLPHGTAVPMGP